MFKEDESKLNKEKLCYNLLSEVYISDAYSGIELDKALKDTPPQDRAYITRLFYGTLENSIRFDYIISKLSARSPQKSVAILLKMGLYMLRYMNIPAYAAINKTVNLACEVGKGGVKGYVNAFLRKSSEVEIPPDNISAYYNFPKFAVDKLVSRYGLDFTKQLLQSEVPRNHVRKSEFILTEKFESIIGLAQKSPLGYYLTIEQIRALSGGQYAIMSLASMLAVHCYLSGERFKNVFDACAAPGGKSIYLKEISPKSEVTCVDIYPHRVQLIKKYAAHMDVNVKCVCSDSTAFNPEYFEKFDLVICDVPCSGFGLKNKPDIFIRRNESDLNKLAQIQYEILSNCASYVKQDGFLCYSTCSVMQEENEDVINKFLAKNKSFALAPIKNELIGQNNGMVNLYPNVHGCDGFFIARLKRVK